MSTQNKGAQVMELDDECEPTKEEISKEEVAKPVMMQNAARWGRFLALVHASSAEWLQGTADTDGYHKSRCIE